MFSMAPSGRATRFWRGVADPTLWIGARSIFGNQRLVGIRRRQFAAGAPATQKLIERRLDLLLDRVRSAVAHFGVLEFGMDDIDVVLLGLLGIRQHAGIGLE